jgi:prevent-host-death family protein
VDSISVVELKAHLGRILDQVANGESFTVTRHGVPLAVLQPIIAAGDGDLAAAIEAIRAFGRGHTTGGMSIRDMIEESRR